MVAVLTIDFEKAYDRVVHAYMFKVLERMGVPERMMRWIKCLYDKMVSRILVNGWLMEEVEIKSGVRQGCPLSPVLFVCAIEPLLRMLGRDKLARGIEILGSGGECLSVIGYMDDVTVVCKNEVGLKRVKLLVNVFCMASGFNINLGKSVCKFFGEWSNVEQGGWSVCTSGVRVLGVKFDKDLYGRESWEDESKSREENFILVLEITVFGGKSPYN